MVPLLAEWSDTKSDVKLGGFRSQLQASYVWSHTEELWFKGIYIWKKRNENEQRNPYSKKAKFIYL